MQQKADHPHLAAVHLMKSLKCCKQCNQSQQIDHRQILQMQVRKQALAQQLRCLTAMRGQPLQQLQDQIIGLQKLITRLKQQNQMAYNFGKAQVDRMIQDRNKFQQQTKQQILIMIQTEKQKNSQMNFQIQSLMEKIRQLHRINNDLIYNFCNY